MKTQPKNQAEMTISSASKFEEIVELQQETLVGGSPIAVSRSLGSSAVMSVAGTARPAWAIGLR